MDLHEELSKYADGKGTPFEAVIQSTRDFLGTIPDLRNCKGGLIIFFQKKNDDNSLDMQVFPFLKNVQLFSDSVSEEARLKILKRINQPKPYTEFWHCEHFKSNNHTPEHFTAKVPEESILNYSEFDKDDWETFASKVDTGEIDKNTYEQVLVKSGCKEVALIPLPVLSTPSILLALDRDTVIQNLQYLFRSLYFRSRDFISKYLYTRLLTSLSSYIKETGVKINADNLLDEFIKQLCHVLLPISYQVDDGEEIPYYNKWPSGDCISTYTLRLNDKKVTFKLTSYCYVNFEQDSIHAQEPYKLLHDNLIYKAAIEQSSILIQNIFDILHDYWSVLSEIEDLVEAQIHERVSSVINNIHTEIGQVLWKNVDEAIRKREKITSGIATNTFIVRYNEQTKPFGFITLKTNGVIYRNEKMSRGTASRSNNVLSGFLYIHEIIKRFSTVPNHPPIDAEQLFDEVITPKSEDVLKTHESHKSESYAKNGFSTTKNAQQGYDSVTVMRDESLNSILEALIAFNKQYDINSTFNLKGEKLQEYYRTLTYLFKTVAGLKRLPEAIIRNSNKISNEIRVQSSLLLTHVNNAKAINIDAWNSHYRNTDKSLHFTGINKAKSQLDKLNNARGRKQSAIRDCIKAAIKELNSLSKVGENEEFIRPLLLNLERSGLIKVDSNEPANTFQYKYNQPKDSDAIIWTLEDNSQDLGNT